MSENKVRENGQELLLPTWLTKKYLEKVLREHEKDESINVHKFNGSPATAKGNNYASVMLRINVEYEKNSKKLLKSMVIKTIHQDESSAKILEEHGTHHKEMTIYGRIIPKFQCLLEAIGDTDKLCPYTYTNDDKNEALIFQDLKESGYELANRKTGVDWSHVELYLRKIAKFHACSKVLMEKTGETYPEFQRGLMHKDVHAFEPFFKLNMEALAQEVEQWIGYEQYSQKLYKLVDLIIKQGTELFLRNEQQFNVLIHGDSWVANMMFKYNEQAEPIDVILLDHQINYYGSFAFDLIYFIATSAQDNIKYNCFDKAIQIYHLTLTDTLHKLNYKGKIPTLFELTLECVQKSFYEVISIATIFPVIINEREENADIGTLVGSDKVSQEFRKQLMTNKRLKANVKHFLPLWDAKGLLDPL